MVFNLDHGGGGMKGNEATPGEVLLGSGGKRRLEKMTIQKELRSYTYTTNVNTNLKSPLDE